MARTIQKLTPLAVNKISKPGWTGDGGGLWLQVSKEGTKSWVFRYTIKGKQFVMGLGALHTVGLVEARAKAHEYRQMLHEGKNPQNERAAATAAALAAAEQERARAMTFDQCAAAYIEAMRGEWKNAKHVSQWQNTLATYASPIIGALPVGDIDTGLVVKVLQPIWSTKTETATRVRQRIEKVLDWAKTSRYRTGENPALWRGNLENLLPKPGKIRKVAHHEALPWQETVAFMADLRTRRGTAARALEFAILTAARSGEARGARWDEIRGDVWTLPAERMKAGREHTVPLSTAALALLEGLPRTGALVFPGGKTKRGKKDPQLSAEALTAVLTRMGRDNLTVHGFRSTFRDWCAESQSFPREVAEHALAHSLPDKVEAAYQRATLIEKRTRLMQAWSDYCAFTA